MRTVILRVLAIALAVMELPLAVVYGQKKDEPPANGRRGEGIAALAEFGGTQSTTIIGAVGGHGSLQKEDSD